jgi:hypothetical protein
MSSREGLVLWRFQSNAESQKLRTGVVPPLIPHLLNKSPGEQDHVFTTKSMHQANSAITFKGSVASHEVRVDEK